MIAFTITCHRSAASIAGAGVATLKGRDGRPLPFATLEDARTEADRLNATTVSPHVHYVANPTPLEIAHVD